MKVDITLGTLHIHVHFHDGADGAESLKKISDLGAMLDASKSGMQAAVDAATPVETQ